MYTRVDIYIHINRGREITKERFAAKNATYQRSVEYGLSWCVSYHTNSLCELPAACPLEPVLF